MILGVLFVCVFNSVVLDLLGLLLLVWLTCSLVVLWFVVLLVGLCLGLLFACFKFGVWCCLLLLDEFTLLFGCCCYLVIDWWLQLIVLICVFLWVFCWFVCF